MFYTSPELSHWRYYEYDSENVKFCLWYVLYPKWSEDSGVNNTQQSIYIPPDAKP